MMSVHKNKIENDAQNLSKSSQYSKNSSEFKFSDFQTSEFCRVPKESIKKSKSSFSSPFYRISNLSSTSQAEDKFLPEITRWRRASLDDQDAILQLQTVSGKMADVLYRKKSIGELIEKSYFSVVQIDSKGDLISFSAYDSYPNITSIPFSLTDWLSANYKLDGINAGNVLFVHYMVWQPAYEKKFLPLLLETVFVEFVRLKHVIVVKPPKADIPDFYEEYFIPILPLGAEELESNSVQLLLLCLRSSVIQPLTIRTAFEQEWNIIMSEINNIIKNSKSYNTPNVWDFLNLIFHENKKTLICEVLLFALLILRILKIEENAFENKVTGIMILNLKIDLDILNEEFELAPFNGLRKKDDKHDENLRRESHIKPEKSFSKVQRNANLLISSEFLFSQMNWEMILTKLRSSDSFVTEDSLNSSSSSGSQWSLFSLKFSSSVDLDQKDILQKADHKSDILAKFGDINIVIHPSENSMTHFISPKYHGPSNAFVIDFFAIDYSKIDEKLFSFDFLEAAFKTVPDREYCVLLIPTDLLPFPLLDLFVRVTPRLMSNIKQELYLCHKNSLSVMSMSVRSTKKDDLVTINNFLKNVDGGNIVYQDILSSCFEENDNFKSFLLTVGETIAGVSLINSEDYIEQFQMHFEIADFRPSNPHGKESSSVIKHLVVSPLYYNHTRFFVRDIMRLIDVNCLYYACDKPRKNQCNLLTVLGEFAPVKPRKKVRTSYYFGFYSLAEVRLNGLVSEVSNTLIEDSFSLCFLNSRLCGFHKIHINVVIVVVGASRTAISFLENLIFGSEYCFFNYNNLICVTPQTLEIEGVNDDLKDLMFPIRDNFTKKYISKLSLERYVSFIYGIMTGINRSEKYIVVNNKATVRYDYLILTCGFQYLSPIPKAKEAFKGHCENNYKGSLTRFLLRPPEQKKIYKQKHLNNMFIINTNCDAHNALRTLQLLMHKIKSVQENQKKIIIYGHDLHIFLTINTLLKLGIPGEFIVFVEPFPTEATSFTLFNDFSIDQAVLKSVKECKVNYYTDYFLYDWSLSSEDYITAIKFHSRRKQLVIPCLAFFPFLEKLVSDVTFKACNDAGLVYDGRLVINHNFRTNDGCIYAAGPFTKYARRYFANDFNHEYYNSIEIGKKLAEIIRYQINPIEKDKIKEESDLVPQLQDPVLLYCQLPGDFNLFILRKPGKELDLETAYNYYDYGEDLTTGDCQMKNGFGYFRLHLNPEGFVESIVCYTKDNIDYINLSSLYGLHEKLLNNLLLRYDKAMISDFFEYFRQPWALALFHENFQRLRDSNYEAFFRKISANKTFYDQIIEKLELNEWEPLPNSVIQELELKYLKSTIEKDVKNNLLQFLEFYKKDLSIYAIPSVYADFLNKKSNFPQT